MAKPTADGQYSFGWEDGGRKEPEKSDPPLLPGAAKLAERLRRLAKDGIYLGTSSWKYPGWIGQVYHPLRYTTRGRISEKKFQRDCLAEYARIFPTVGGDFSFYQFPRPDFWRETFDQVPADFRFSMKIPEEVTVVRFPDLPRYGRRAGRENPSFMDAGMLSELLLKPLEPYRDRLGVLMFEFGTIHDGPLREAGAFADALSEMFIRLPCDRFRFAVEVRNREFVAAQSPYFECLRERRVAHCLNSWTRMPSLAEQLATPGIFTADHVAARLLLSPGRTYQQAVEKFSPYERVQEPYPEGRDALAELIRRARAHQQALFAFVNNRFEGNAVQTIDEVTAGD